MSTPQHLTLRRGDTLDLTLFGLGDLSAVDDVWFTVKRRLSDADSAAQIQVSLDGGLLAIAGALATNAANGVLTIVHAVRGIVNISVAAEEMAKLSNDYVGYWDVQTLTGTVVATVNYGNAQFYGDATRRLV